MKIFLILIIVTSSFAYSVDPGLLHYENPLELMNEDPAPLLPPATPVPAEIEDVGEAEYEDCNIMANGTVVPPTQQIPGYKCYPARNPDLITNDNGQIPGIEADNLLLRRLRANLLGISDVNEQNNGREPGQSCYKHIGENPLTTTYFHMYDEDLELSAPNSAVSKKLATPRIPPMVNQSKVMSFLSLGCRTNRCGPKADTPINTAEPYAHLECKDRYSYRCLDIGEVTPNKESCCPGLERNSAGKCELPIVEEESVLEGFPNHVDSATGLIKFQDDPETRKLAGGKIAMAITSIRAFEFFFSEQNTGSRKKVPDDKVMQPLGQRFKERMLRALDTYNRELEELEELKNSFVELSKQMKDPEEYYLEQGNVSYRNYRFQSAKEFKQFVQNSTSGAEIFRLMADEQKIQLKYENTIYHALIDAIEGADGKNLNYLLQEWQNRSPNRRKEGNIFGHSFRHKYRRKFKSRWNIRYRISSRGKRKLIEKMSESPQAHQLAEQIKAQYPGNRFIESYAMTIALKKLNLYSKYLIEPYLVKGLSTGDFGRGGRKRRRLTRGRDITRLFDAFKGKFREYIKTTYFNRPNEIFDVSLGGLKECLTDNDFPIKDTEYCSRYKNTIDIIENDVVQLFFKASASRSKKYYGTTITKKKEFFHEQISRLTHAMGIYEHMSAIPDSLGGVAFLGYQNVDFQKLFDEYNENIPGFLRFKSYLFYMAKAKKIESGMIADTGIDTGESPYSPTGLYGSGNTVVNIENSTNQQDTSVASGITSTINPNTAAVTSAGSITNAAGISTDSNAGTAGANASQSNYQRSLAKLNKSAIDFKKKNPKLRSTLDKLARINNETRNKTLSRVASQLGSGASAKGLLTAIQDPGLSSLKDKIGSKTSNKNIDSSRFTQAISDNNSNSNNESLYKENSTSPSSSSSSSPNQLTSLSDYQLKQAIKNSKDQAHLYKSSEYDGIFEKISKTYARSYSKFLVKKTRNSDQTQLKDSRESLEAIKDKAKVMKMLNGF